MKDMSNEELINKFRAMCNLFIIYGKFQKEQDFNEANKISDKLLSRLSAGEAAVKKVAELENEIKEWENSRDEALISSQAKNFKIMELEKDKRELVEALEAIRKVVVVACGDKAPYIKIALERLDAALAKHKEAL